MRSFAIAGLVSFFMLLYAGYIYLTAAGSAGRTTQARGYIKSALYGLGILFAAYTILYTINPDLVGVEGGLIKTSNETVVKYDLDSIAPDLTDIDGIIPAPNDARISEKLLNSLASVYAQDQSWEITESFPTTSQDADSALRNGYAVKIKIKDNANLTPEQIAKLIKLFTDAGLKVDDHYTISAQSMIIAAEGQINPDGYLYVQGEPVNQGAEFAGTDGVLSGGAGTSTDGGGSLAGGGRGTGTSPGPQPGPTATPASSGFPPSQDPIFDVQPRQVSSNGQVKIYWNVEEEMEKHPSDALFVFGLETPGTSDWVDICNDVISVHTGLLSQGKTGRGCDLKGELVFRLNLVRGIQNVKFVLNIYNNPRNTMSPSYHREASIAIQESAGGGGGGAPGGGGGGGVLTCVNRSSVNPGPNGRSIVLGEYYYPKGGNKWISRGIKTEFSLGDKIIIKDSRVTLGYPPVSGVLPYELGDNGGGIGPLSQRLEPAEFAEILGFIGGKSLGIEPDRFALAVELTTSGTVGGEICYDDPDVRGGGSTIPRYLAVTRNDNLATVKSGAGGGGGSGGPRALILGNYYYPKNGNAWVPTGGKTTFQNGDWIIVQDSRVILTKSGALDQYPLSYKIEDGRPYFLLPLSDNTNEFVTGQVFGASSGGQQQEGHALPVPISVDSGTISAQFYYWDNDARGEGRDKLLEIVTASGLATIGSSLGGSANCPSNLGACTIATSCGAFQCGGENWYCRSGSWAKEGQIADCAGGNYCAATSCGGSTYYCTSQGWQVPLSGKTCQNGQFE